MEKRWSYIHIIHHKQKNFKKISTIKMELYKFWKKSVMNFCFHQGIRKNFLIMTQNSEAINTDKFVHIKTKANFCMAKTKRWMTPWGKTVAIYHRKGLITLICSNLLNINKKKNNLILKMGKNTDSFQKRNDNNCWWMVNINKWCSIFLL